MLGIRCGVGIGGENLVSIGDIWVVYEGGVIVVLVDIKVCGVVIFDWVNENWDGCNMVL